MANKPAYEKLEQNHQVALTPWRMYLVICIVGLMITGILGYGFFKGNRMNKVYAPLIDAAMEIKVEATTAHLWFEEIINGDRHEDISVVWKHQGQAEWYAQAMMEGGKNQEGTYMPLDDAEMRRKIKNVQGKLKTFREIAQERIEAKGTSGIGTDIDQRHDHVFRSFLKEVDEVETRLQQIMANDLNDFRHTQVLLIVISLLLFLAIGISFWYFDNQRIKNLLLLNEANRALRRSEKQALASLEAARGFTFSYDIASGKIEWDGSIEKITGYTPEEFAHVDIEGWAEKIHPDERDDILSILEKSVQRDRATAEYRFRTKCGDYIVLASISLTERDEKGLPVRLVGILQDITETKKIHAEAMRAGHLAALGELAAGVAHEINNPVNGIISYAEILKDEFNDRGEDDDIPTRIIKEGDRVAEIVKNLLVFARDRKEEHNPTHIHDILSDALALVERQIAKDGIKLNVDVSPDLPKIKARSQEIQQVFLNIISNARYALNQRFPEFHEDKVFEIRAETLEIEGMNYARIIFYDRGTGISTRLLDRIREPFYSTKPKNEGTGLGLSISHGIVENHRGKLRFESVEGAYTKVIVDLPLNKGREL